MSNTPKRKLSVVLFADIEGYTALMQENEKKAMQVIHKFKETAENLAPEYDGKVVQYYGDGCLMTFDSCTQAVQCSLEMQKLFLSSLKVPVRIGIHLGDVVFESGNAYGDGVNIASRIENLGVPGSVLLSRSVMNQVRNKEEFSLLSLGHFELKNVIDPVEVYALENAGLAVPKVHQTKELPKQSKTGLPLKWIPGIIGMLILGILGYQNLTQEDSHIRYGAEESTLEKVGESYVLTIGVDNNPDWLRLTNAKNDALGLREVLINQYHFRDLQEPLINEIATGKNISDAIDKARGLLKENDELIVFYAGHGYSDIFEDDSKSPTGYIIPYDAAPENDNNFDSYIRIEDFLQEISELPAMHITTIFDACYSGFAIGENLLVSRGARLSSIKASKTKSRKVFSSANFDQTAVDNGPIPGHSLFTGILIESLRTAQADNNSDGMISMNELALYIEKNIYDLSPIEQTPTYGFHSSDKGGEMFLLYNPNEVTFEKTRIDVIKNDKEIYTALPFRTSTPGKGLDLLMRFIPNTILSAISDYDKRRYNVDVIDFIRLSDSIIINRPYKDYLSNSDASKYFSGVFDTFDDMVVIKIRLINADNNNIIYSFPDMTATVNGDSDVEALGKAIKKRIMGFMDNNQQVIDRLTIPPNYQAYRHLKSGYDMMCNDPEKAREYFDKAIELDHKYFRGHLAKAFSYVNCKPVNVYKAIEEWKKFKDIDFELTYYEEERFKNLEYEFRGDFEKLVNPKFDLFKDFQTRSTFGDAAWYALAAFNIDLSKEMIAISESNDISDDFRNYLFVIKNKIEQYCEPIQEPQLYERFKQEEDIIKQYPIYFFYSKVLFDCKENCFSEIQNHFNEHAFTKSEMALWNRIAGDVTSYKGNYSIARSFYTRAQLLFQELEKEDVDEIVEIEYKLANYDTVIALTENRLDTLLNNGEYSAVRYFILAKMKLDQPIENKESLISRIKNRKDFIGFGYYYVASILCAEENFKEANKYLKLAKENGVGLTPERYNFDYIFKNMWEDPEFKRLTKLKI